MNLMNFPRPLTWQDLVFNVSNGNILGILQEALVQGKSDAQLMNIINGFLESSNGDVQQLQKYIPFFIYYSAQFRRFTFLEWLLNEKNFPIDCTSTEGKTPLCYLVEGGAPNYEGVCYLLSKGARVYIPESIYQPLLCCLHNKNFEQIFFHLLNERRSPLNLIDPDTGETIIIKLIKLLGEPSGIEGPETGNEIILRFCLDFNRKHGKDEFLHYLNYRRHQFKSAVEVACLLGRYNLTKFFIINGAQLPFDNILETKYSFAKVYQFDKQIWIAERQNPTMFEFFQKIRMMKCRDWDRLNFNILRSIYTLPYSKIDVIRACVKCCQEQMSHDCDSIRFFCEKYQKNKRAAVVQRTFRKRKPSDASVAAIRIQRWWRTFYYTKKNKITLFCPICRSEDIDNPIWGHSWYLLPCRRHPVHTYCLNKWQRACPTCRATFSHPLGRFGEWFP